MVPTGMSHVEISKGLGGEIEKEMRLCGLDTVLTKQPQICEQTPEMA